ncbi:MAG: serine/threonine-protein kinase, partial [Gemmatimonadota bacterium]
MKRERWDVVVSLFEEALAVKPPERRAFVETAARGDAALRDEVLALLAADESVHPLFSMSPAGLAAAVQVPANTSYAGRQIGAYKLIREIGRGGMATVYHAEDTKHRRAVALKLLDAGASTALGGERFRREIDVLARLQHHNILPLFDSGEAEGLLYYVMPLVGGGTLRERIAREGPLAIDDVRRITSQIAAGLEYAHKHHVIHRDVKPANVLLDDDHASIGDFGIAQGTAPVDGGRLTLTGVFVGTPAYMSPEHVAGGGQLDARSDVYSLACVVFEMLTGKPPFQGTSPSALLGKHLHDTAPSARTGRPELPTAVASVLQRALEKDPNARYASAREFARAFENAFEQARTLPSAVTIGTRRWVVIAAVAALVAVAGALLWNATREMPSIAVLPFVNMSGDQANDYFSDGVTEELTSALAQLGRVRVT